MEDSSVLAKRHDNRIGEFMADAGRWLAYFARHKKLLPVLKKADNIAVCIQLYWKIICLMLKYFTRFADWEGMHHQNIL